MRKPKTIRAYLHLFDFEEMTQEEQTALFDWMESTVVYLKSGKPVADVWKATIYRPR